MLRIDRMRNDPAFTTAVLQTAEHLFLAMVETEASGQTIPYVVPMNFVYTAPYIYLHCANKGKKIALLQKNPHIAFSTIQNATVLPDRATTAYSCVCGVGTATIVAEKSEKSRALEALAKRYHAACTMPPSEQELEHTTIIRLDIESLSGKCSPMD